MDTQRRFFLRLGRNIEVFPNSASGVRIRRLERLSKPLLCTFQWGAAPENWIADWAGHNFQITQDRWREITTGAYFLRFDQYDIEKVGNQVHCHKSIFRKYQLICKERYGCDAVHTDSPVIFIRRNYHLTLISIKNCYESVSSPRLVTGVLQTPMLPLHHDPWGTEQLPICGLPLLVEGW